MAVSGLVAVRLLVAGFYVVAQCRPNVPTCPDTDYTKCRDNGNDCCVSRGDWPETHSCADGYKVVETHAKCATPETQTDIEKHREYSCVPQDSKCEGLDHDPDYYDEWFNDQWIYYYDSCDHYEDEDGEWHGRVVRGSVIGSIIAIVCVVLVSLPVCCGVMKESKFLTKIAIIVGLVAAFCNFIPLIAATDSTNQAIDDHCERCHCDDADERIARAHWSFWGSIYAYFVGFGWFVIFLASVSEVLACCMCCPCCGPLKRYRDEQRQGFVAPTVVGAPVAGAPQGLVQGAPATIDNKCCS